MSKAVTLGWALSLMKKKVYCSLRKRVEVFLAEELGKRWSQIKDCVLLVHDQNYSEVLQQHRKGQWELMDIHLQIFCRYMYKLDLPIILAVVP